MPEDSRDRPEEHQEAAEPEEEGKVAEAASGPGGKISQIDRSFLAAEAPELTRRQLDELRRKLRNKFH